jgi:hypothetical protein
MANKRPNEQPSLEWFSFRGERFYKVVEVNSRYELTSGVCVGNRNGWMTLRLGDGTLLKRRCGSDNWYVDPVMAVDAVIRDTALKYSAKPLLLLLLPDKLEPLYRLREEVNQRFRKGGTEDNISGRDNMQSGKRIHGPVAHRLD